MFNTLTRMGASGAADYEIERSLNFNQADDTYLERTPSSAGSTTTGTISLWVKRSSLNIETDHDGHTLCGTGGGGSGSSGTWIEFRDTDCGQLQLSTALSGSNTGKLKTNRLFRDFSAWMHIVAVVDTSNGTSGDRLRLFVNGERQTDFATETYPDQDQAVYLNTNDRFGIGAYRSWSDQTSKYNYFDGYIADFYLIDGTALNADSFGQTDASTGQWIPKKYGGSYGTNGFFLDFSDNSGTSATTLGKDSSGNGNNFTPSNFSVTAGKDDDSMLDTPTNNFPTLSPVDRSLVGTISNGALRVSYNYKPASKTWRATMALPATGKFYWEWENEEASSHPGRWQTGLVRYTYEAGVLDHQGYNDADYFSVSYGGSIWNGTTHINPSWGSNPTFYSGERVAIAIDCSNGKTWVGKVASGGGTTWYDDDGTTDGDPAGGTNETCTITGFTTGNWMPVIMWNEGGGAVTDAFTSNINFGNHSFLGTPPTGFNKLCTANLPDPTIKLPNKHFEARAYTGTGAGNTQTLTGFEFAPDMVWIKNRTSAYNHALYDTVRGASNRLYPNLKNAEASNAALSAFTSDGYTVGTDAANENNQSSWNWNESATAGFDIVSYTGNGSAGNTVSHSLGVAPDLMIIKNRTTAGPHWFCYMRSMGNTTWIPLDTNSTANTSVTDTLNSTSPTSSIFTLGNSTKVNSSSTDYIAYLWSAVPGYSKFWYYTGNGNADGSFVYTGFKPAFLVAKNTATTNYWRMWDHKVQPTNPVATGFYPNVANAEDAPVNWTLDFLSNGFKVRNDDGEMNGNGQDIIYWAWAEAPFQYSNAD